MLAVGAALRFATLDVQSFWLDEAFSVRLLRLDLGGMLEELPRSESSPPLYYLLAWSWGRVLGTGEVGSRALPALLGTLTIPVAYAAGRELLDRRAGLVAAALVACNPLLVWYSQETRAYALLVLCSALSFLFFVRAWRDPGPRSLAIWAVASALALLSHYFAGFLVLFEALALLVMAVRARRGTGATVLAAAVPALTALALLPLLLAQRDTGNTEWIGQRSLLDNLAGVPRRFLAGETGGPVRGMAWVAGVLVAAGLVLLFVRATPDRRRAAGLALGAGAAVIALPLALALFGDDYLQARNVLPGLVPFAVALAGGLGAARAGRVGVALGAALCAIWIAVSLAVAADDGRQRADWRELARRLGSLPPGSALVVVPDYEARPLREYASGLRLADRPVTAARIDVVRSEFSPVHGPLPPPLPGLVAAGRRTVQKLRIDSFRSPRPVAVSARALRPRLGNVAVLSRTG